MIPILKCLMLSILETLQLTCKYWDVGLEHVDQTAEALHGAVVRVGRVVRGSSGGEHPAETRR